MNAMYKMASRLPNYVKAFGAINGLRLLPRIERALSRGSDEVRRFRVPGYPAPIFLRDTVSDHSIFWQCIVRSQYDMRKFDQYSRLMDAYNSIVASGKNAVVIDCGGNIGLSVLYFATLFARAIVVAIEPDLPNIRIMNMNISQFGDRVRVVHGAVWDKHGSLVITNPDSGSSAFRVDELGTKRQENSFPAYTVNDLCQLVGADSPFAIKIDIEGAQAHLFSDNTEWIENCHLIMIELDDWQMPWRGTSRNFFKCISKYPFDYLQSGEILFCFRDFQADAP